MRLCRGTRDNHCCYVDGLVCPFYDGECRLRRELGSWEAVYQDKQYLTVVQPMWDRLAPGNGCGDWPLPGMTCATCGVKNG